MRKTIYVLMPLVFLAACTKDISKLNVETKKASVVTAGPLFANAVKTLADNYGSASVNINVFRFTVKHWAMAVYQDEAQYDFATRNIPQTWWTAMYRDVLNDLNESARIANSDPFITAEVKANQLAIVDVMQVY